MDAEQKHCVDQYTAMREHKDDDKSMAIQVALYNDDGTRGGSNDSVVVQLQSLPVSYTHLTLPTKRIV